MIKPIKKWLLMLLGSMAVTLGIIGVFVPVLPTTPFLLLASLCYVRSSDRMYNWLINHKIFGAYIYNYLTFRSVSKKIKIGTLIFLWISLMLSIFIVNDLYLKILLLTIGIAVSVHLLSLKTN